MKEQVALVLCTGGAPEWDDGAGPSYDGGGGFEDDDGPDWQQGAASTLWAL